jgi:hypothetical protein
MNEFGKKTHTHRKVFYENKSRRFYYGENMMIKLEFNSLDKNVSRFM